MERFDGKGVINFWRGFSVLPVAVTNFTSRLFFDLLFTCRLKEMYQFIDIFHYDFSLFRFIKGLFNSLLF